MESNGQDIAAANLKAMIEEERARANRAEEIAKSIVEEFTSCGDFDDVRAKFRDKIKEFAPVAIINIMEMANHAESESVRASLNKWVVEWAMSDKIDTSTSEIADLIKTLKNNSTSPTNSTSDLA